MIDLSNITDEEERVIVRALKHLRYETLAAQRKNALKGWAPKPGRTDVTVTTLRVLNALLDRVKEEAGQ